VDGAAMTKAVFPLGTFGYDDDNNADTAFTVAADARVNGKAIVGPESDPSAGVDPYQTPPAITDLSVAAGDSQLTLNFTPVETGRQVVYHISGAPDQATSTVPIVLTGLSNGTTYNVAVTAENVSGDKPDGPPSNTVGATPHTAPTIQGVSGNATGQT